MALSGKHLVVAGFGDPNYEYQLKLQVFPNGSVSFSSGFSLDILRLLQFCLNFTFSCVDGIGWIGVLPNGSLTGIGKVILEGSDLGINPSSIVASRIPKLTYLHPIMDGGMVAALTQPPGSSIRDLVTSSFTSSVWITAFVTSALALLFLKVIALLRLKGHFLGESDNSPAVVLEEPVFWILLTFCQRGISASPSSYPLRITYASIIITSLVGYTAYTAALVVTLTQDVTPIKSFDDLMTSRLPIVGDSSIDFTHDFIRGLNRRRPWEEVQESRFLDARSGVSGIIRGELAFASFQDALYGIYGSLRLNEDFVCTKIFHFIAAGTKTKGAMVVPKGSPFKEHFNAKLATLKERGFLRRELGKWDAETVPLCSAFSSAQSAPPLTLQDVVTAFFAFAAGVAGSAGLLLLENSLHRCSTWRNHCDIAASSFKLLFKLIRRPIKN